MKINIKGPIIPSSYQRVYDWFGIEATSPKKVSDLIEEANGEELEVEINSGGGSVTAGSEIYTALRSYKGNTKGTIVGIAASAASVIAMGCKHLSMSPTGQLMIHNSSTWAEGDYREMQHTADVLKTVNETIANAYRLRTGKTEEELFALMDKETWMTAKKAKELGFIDSVMFEDENQFVANFNNSELLPPEVVNKVLNIIANEVNEESEDEEIETDDTNQNQIDLVKAKLALEIEASYFNFKEEM